MTETNRDIRSRDEASSQSTNNKMDRHLQATGGGETHKGKK
jgi:hypothetical protein